VFLSYAVLILGMRYSVCVTSRVRGIDQRNSNPIDMDVQRSSKNRPSYCLCGRSVFDFLVCVYCTRRRDATDRRQVQNRFSKTNARQSKINRTRFEWFFFSVETFDGTAVWKTYLEFVNVTARHDDSYEKRCFDICFFPRPAKQRIIVVISLKRTCTWPGPNRNRALEVSRKKEAKKKSTRASFKKREERMNGDGRVEKRSYDDVETRQ